MVHMRTNAALNLFYCETQSLSQVLANVRTARKEKRHLWHLTSSVQRPTKEPSMPNYAPWIAQGTPVVAGNVKVSLSRASRVTNGICLNGTLQSSSSTATLTARTPGRARTKKTAFPAAHCPARRAIILMTKVLPLSCQMAPARLHPYRPPRPSRSLRPELDFNFAFLLVLFYDWLFASTGVFHSRCIDRGQLAWRSGIGKKFGGWGGKTGIGLCIRTHQKYGSLLVV